jgi:tetratricopeptide (TPR) repeat protein
MTAGYEWGGRVLGALMRRVPALLVLAFLSAPAFAEDKAQLFVTNEPGFGRLLLNFPERMDLPEYRIRYDNGVLAVEFDEPLTAVLPDVAAGIPDYVTIARIDPDRKGIRFGLRSDLKINHLEAGEKLFIDLMPEGWQGLPPGLPPSVVAALTERAEHAAKIAEQKRLAEEALRLKPVPTVRVGRNPTFLRVQFSWNVDAEAEFAVEGTATEVSFNWPVPVDLYPIRANLPPELLAVENAVDANGSRVTFTTADGVVPRFYEISPTEFVVDIDIVPTSPPGTITLSDIEGAAHEEHAEPVTAMAEAPAHAQTEVVPYATIMGGTIRLVFPFESDVAAAVFRRGDSIWMLFDTHTVIAEPQNLETLTPAASGFSVLGSGETQLVRLDLKTERLATLGTEGRSWVLSLGDVILSPTEPVPLNRRRDAQAQLEMTADLGEPGAVHQFRDPMAGDILTVVTAFPPARGVVRSLDFVEFTALTSVHGLVVRPKSDEIKVTLDGSLAVIHGGIEGLSLSAADHYSRGMAAGSDPGKRAGYLNLAALDAESPPAYLEEENTLLHKTANIEDPAALAEARLELAQFYVANRFAEEAIGVLSVLASSTVSADVSQRLRLTRAIADTLAVRPNDAIAILTEPAFLEDPDAVMWRAMARSEAGDYRGSRLDAMASEVVVDSYPAWVRQRFLLGAVRAAIETGDAHLGHRYLGQIEFASLDPEQQSYYTLYVGRLAELENRAQEAIDAYGQVIAADIRPSRAEAVFRTLLVLDAEGKLDVAKAAQTLAAETILWRGSLLEPSMLKLLADLYFRNNDYRLGFETVQQAVQFGPDTADADALNDIAQTRFADLFLNGAADQLDPVEALTLFYDFRTLTPPGARGDEMIRNLARRLVDVDLLAQAGDLLQYQIDNRLEGPAEAQIAAELAIIRIAQRDPEAALRALNQSRLADLSPTLERQRRVLEAKALIDAGREDLAVDLISSLTGRDADLLRIEGLWLAGQYGAASELIETTYGADPADLLSQPSRMSIVRAAVGFVLAKDQLGLSRLRSKFGEQMALSPEWPMFDYVTGPITANSSEFRAIAAEVGALDRLNAFLSAYRETYGKDAAPEAASL